MGKVVDTFAGNGAVGFEQELLFGDMELERKLGEGGMGIVQLRRSKRTGERFAVKGAKFLDWNSQRNFLLELMTWYGLPRHPHIVECRFFRTLQDDNESQIAIFAEYVPGGKLASGEEHGSSLADWIKVGKLTSLDQILDVAIQFAWGLHAAHELGVVHQDVKPGNVLLSLDFPLPVAEGGDGGDRFLVRVADFGLAKARTRAIHSSAAPTQSIAVTAGLFTKEYCSPEQFAGERLTRQTDIWSWGISILDMFTGKPNKSIGERTHRVVLKEYLKSGPDDPRLPRMPDSLVEILVKCFREDAAERWTTMAEVENALRDVYRQSVGRAYSRPVPLEPYENGLKVVERGPLDGPRQWLMWASQADGQNPAEAETLLVSANSRKSQPIADLIGYEEALRILDRAIAKGCQHLESTLAGLYNAKASVHRHVHDAPGAFALYDRAISIRERMVQRAGQNEGWHEFFLAMNYEQKAVLLDESGNGRRAVEVFDQAIAIYERLVQEGQHQLVDALAETYSNKAVALRQLGDLRGAVALYDQAIVFYEPLQREGRHDLANRLAGMYQNKAISLAGLGDLGLAVELYDRAIAIRERLMREHGRNNLADALAITYQNKAIATAGLGDLEGAVALYDQVLAIYERLVQQEGRHDMAHLLARAYMNKAVALNQLGDAQGAVALDDRAIAIYERLYQQEARDELAPELAATRQNKAYALAGVGDLRGAAALFDEAIAVYKRLVHDEGRHELANDLANTYQNKAYALASLGDL